MSVEELVKALNEIDDHLTTMGADKLEELAAENERLRGVLMQTGIEWAVRMYDALAEKDKEIAAFREALRRIVNLDEAMGHELTWEHASEAVGIAYAALARNAGGNNA